MNQNKEATVAKTDYSKMSGEELLAAYNEVSVTKRKSKFANREAAVKAIEAATAAAKGSKPAAAEKRTSKLMDKKIKVNTQGNPRKEGTLSHTHFDRAMKSKTYGDYMGHYEGKGEDEADSVRILNSARMWMANFRKAGQIELVDG